MVPANNLIFRKKSEKLNCVKGGSSYFGEVGCNFLGSPPSLIPLSVNHLPQVIDCNLLISLPQIAGVTPSGFVDVKIRI